MAVFASRTVEPWNGAMQRVAVTLALTAEILVAARLLTLPLTGSRARPQPVGMVEGRAEGDYTDLSEIICYGYGDHPRALHDGRRPSPRMNSISACGGKAVDSLPGLCACPIKRLNTTVRGDRER